MSRENNIKFEYRLDDKTIRSILFSPANAPNSNIVFMPMSGQDWSDKIGITFHLQKNNVVYAKISGLPGVNSSEFFDVNTFSTKMARLNFPRMTIKTIKPIGQIPPNALTIRQTTPPPKVVPAAGPIIPPVFATQKVTTLNPISQSKPDKSQPVQKTRVELLSWIPLSTKADATRYFNFYNLYYPRGGASIFWEEKTPQLLRNMYRAIEADKRNGTSLFTLSVFTKSFVDEGLTLFATERLMLEIHRSYVKKINIERENRGEQTKAEQNFNNMKQRLEAIVDWVSGCVTVFGLVGLVTL